MINLIDRPEFSVADVCEEVFQISSLILGHPRASVEAALGAGTLQAKVCLLASLDLPTFVLNFKERVGKLSQDPEKNFEMVN
jgi:hypothetical protein